METEFFTSGGKKWKHLVDKLVREYQRVNNITLRVISDAECEDFQLYKRKYWIKCFLWRLAKPTTQRIVWLDCDLDVCAPIGKLSEAHFSGVLDCEETARKDKIQFNFSGNYFNVGFFTATRVTEPIFETIIQQFDSPTNSGCDEQSWISKLIGNGPNVEVLERKYNFLCGAPGWIQPKDLIHLHYAGLERKWMIPGVEDVYSKPFRIETEDYIITNTRLTCRKGIQGQDLWRKHGIQGAVLENLAGDTIMLGGQRTAVRCFRIIAMQLDTGDLARIEALEKGRMKRWPK